MIRNRLFPKWAVVLLVIQVSLLSVTLASAHGGNTGLIHSCVNNTSGEIKIISANATCPSSSRSLDWNIQGPAGQQGPIGPVGPAGPQGEQGPQGLAGPAGISGLEVVQAYSGTLDQFRIDVVVDCPAGKKVLGGGFQSVGDNQYANVMANAPLGDHEWAVTLFQSDLTARLWSVQAFAICANVAP